MLNTFRQGAVVRVLAAALGLAFGSAGAQTVSIDLQGEASGYLGLSNFKVWTNRADAEASLFPFWEQTYANGGVLYPTIAALPLSAGTQYFEESLGLVVENKTQTQADFSSMSAGSISYDAAQVTGVGVEVIGPSGLSLSFNNAGFSPSTSPYNTGGGVGNFGLDVALSASSLSGTGLTFTNGVLTSIDLSSSLSVSVSSFAGTFANPYVGSLSISGNQYVFSVNQLQNNVVNAETCITPTFCIPTPVEFSNTRVVMDRSGLISAVTPVPEPSTYALMAGGLLAVGALARRRRRAAERG